MGWNPGGHPKWKTTHRTKWKANRDGDGRRRWWRRRRRNAGRSRENIRHIGEMDGMPRYGQIPKTTWYKYTQMEKCLKVRILKKIDGQTETLIDRIGSVVYLIEEIFGYDNFVMLQANHGAERRVHHNHYREVYKNHKTFCRTTDCNLAPHQASRRTPEREEGMLYGSSVNEEHLTFTEFRL